MMTDSVELNATSSFDVREMILQEDKPTESTPAVDSNICSLRQSWDIPQLPQNKDYHIFISYVQENSAEVRIIVADLERNGLKCCYHERDFCPGQQVIGNIHESIARSMGILVVLSKDFVRSRFCNHELEQALHARISEKYVIIPIKIEPCEIPERLKTFTHIEAENVETNEMHLKILDAFILNVWHKTPNDETNGFTLSFPLHAYYVGYKWFSVRRSKFAFDRNKICNNNFQISTADMDAIEKNINNSVHVKYAHIFRMFLRLMLLLCFMEVLLFTGIVVIIVTYTADRSMNSANMATVSNTVLGNSIGAFSLWLMLSAIHMVGCFNPSKSWRGLTYALEERSKMRLKRDIWRKFNSRFAEKNNLIVTSDTSRLHLIKYNLQPCKDLFIRRCGNNEALKRGLHQGETLEAYTRRLFRDFIRDHVEMLFAPTDSNDGHKMANRAKCLCSLVQEKWEPIMPDR